MDVSARGELVYANQLATADDVAGFVLEGDAAVSFPLGRLRMESAGDGNFVFWCPEVLPDRVAVSWDFWPVREPGLCMLFFAAAGRHGEDLFAADLAPRDGTYDQYHSGDIDAYHVSYFRRKDDRRLHTCNLRKSHGFHLVAQGADPIPAASDAAPPYRMTVVSFAGHAALWVDDLRVLHWSDDGSVGGPPLGGGRIGLRQMTPLIAEYANLEVHALHRPPPRTSG